MFPPGRAALRHCGSPSSRPGGVHRPAAMIRRTWSVQTCLPSAEAEPFLVSLPGPGRNGGQKVICAGIGIVDQSLTVPQRNFQLGTTISHPLDRNAGYQRMTGKYRFPDDREIRSAIAGRGACLHQVSGHSLCAFPRCAQFARCSGSGQYGILRTSVTVRSAPARSGASERPH